MVTITGECLARTLSPKPLGVCQQLTQPTLSWQRGRAELGCSSVVETGFIMAWLPSPERERFDDSSNTCLLSQHLVGWGRGIMKLRLTWGYIMRPCLTGHNKQIGAAIGFHPPNSWVWLALEMNRCVSDLGLVRQAGRAPNG